MLSDRPNVNQTFKLFRINDYLILYYEACTLHKLNSKCKKSRFVIRVCWLRTNNLSIYIEFFSIEVDFLSLRLLEYFVQTVASYLLEDSSQLSAPNGC